MGWVCFLMDRFIWLENSDLSADEQLVAQFSGVRVYDGENKVRICGLFACCWKCCHNNYSFIFSE